MANQEERIVLEAEEGPVLESVGKANAALERYEKSGARASQTVGKSFNQSGETIIRAMDRSRASAERLVASIEKKAAMAGKSGVEKLVAERDVLIRRLSGEERAIQRAKTAYDKLIAAQRRTSDSNRDFGDSIREFVQNPLHSAGNMVQGFVGRLGAIGTAAAAAAVGVGLAVKASMNLVTTLGTEADLMSNLAERTGLSVNQIDKLQAMARLAHTGSAINGGVNAYSWNTFALSNLSNISKTGYTGTRWGVSGGEPTGGNVVVPRTVDSANDPNMSLTYTLPSNAIISVIATDD